jgi:CDGSH-type Zn-finger protein
MIKLLGGYQERLFASTNRITKQELMIMDGPVIAQRAPIPVDVEAGKTYFWCACGKSQNQPFCDGAHKDTVFTPIKYEAEQATKVFFCCCKHSKSVPICDGTHKTLQVG